MSKKNRKMSIVAGIAMTTVAISHFMKSSAVTSKKAIGMKPLATRRMGFYEKYIKRMVDVVGSTGAIVALSPIWIGVAVVVRAKIGSPIFFVQERPGQVGRDGKETIFKMIKFRTMSNERDEKGELLSDNLRLTRVGAFLRSTSLDEIPELINILNGTMSFIGPRPQLVRDLVFMTNEQRMRHTAKPGLSGLAQVNGRNAISWEDKFDFDLRYTEHVSLKDDLLILLKTLKKAFIEREGITQEGMATSEDLGDYLLRTNKVSQSEYLEKQQKAQTMLSGEDERDLEDNLISIVMPVYNAEKYIEKTIRSVQKQTYTDWELVVVDDCSTDNTLALIETFRDERIRIYVNDENSGAAISRNRALREAKGRWVAFLDGDDIWKSTKLEEQLAFMREKKYAFTYTDYRTQVNGKWLPYVNIGPNMVNKRKMYDYCYFSTITVMYDQRRVGLIQVADLRKNNDYAMWLKAVEKVKCYRYPRCLSYYIKHDGSVSSGSKVKLIKWHYYLYRKGQGMNPIVSGVLTANNLFHGVIKKMIYKKRTSCIPELND